MPGIVSATPAARAIRSRAREASGHRSHGSYPARESLNLVAALLTSQTPFTEVLAIVGQEAVALLSQARLGAVDDFLRRKFRRYPAPHGYRSSSAKVSQRNLLHRSPGEEAGNCPTVYDFSVAHVDAMMDIADARCDQMRAKRRLFRHGQRMVPPRQETFEESRMRLHPVAYPMPYPPCAEVSTTVPGRRTFFPMNAKSEFIPRSECFQGCQHLARS